MMPRTLPNGSTTEADEARAAPSDCLELPGAQQHQSDAGAQLAGRREDRTTPGPDQPQPGHERGRALHPPRDPRDHWTRRLDLVRDALISGLALARSVPWGRRR
jgi:hypothetical protein